MLSTAPDPATPDVERLAAAAVRIDIAPHPGDDWETLFFRIFLDRIEPYLGIGAPTILYDYPLSLAALSRRKPSDARLCERFELYVCGLELANAFGELTDPAEQRRRFIADQAKKKALYGETYPIDEDLLMALEQGLAEVPPIALEIREKWRSFEGDLYRELIRRDKESAKALKPNDRIQAGKTNFVFTDGLGTIIGKLEKTDEGYSAYVREISKPKP